MAAAALVLPAAAALRLPAAAFTAAGDGTPPFSRPFVRLGGGTSGCLASASCRRRRQGRVRGIGMIWWWLCSTGRMRTQDEGRQVSGRNDSNNRTRGSGAAESIQQTTRFLQSNLHDSASVRSCQWRLMGSYLDLSRGVALGGHHNLGQVLHHIVLLLVRVLRSNS